MSAAHAVVRQAQLSDVPGMHRVRLAVRENRLTTSVVTEADYVPAITETGRGWVVAAGDEVLAFAVGNAQSGNIWALFVHPDHECEGYGRQLFVVMTEWLWAQGLPRLWLSTAAGTRAEQFYRKAGWRPTGLTASGELGFECLRND